MPGDDDILRIAAQFDVGTITAGMDEAAGAVKAGTAAMNDSFTDLAAAQIRVASANKDLRETLSGTVSKGLTPTVAATEEVAAAMFEAKVATDAFKAAQEQAYGSSQKLTSGVNNSRIAFTGLTQDLGLRGSRALGSFISQSSALGPILQAAFPVVAAVALFEIIETGYDKLHKLAIAGEINAEAWQKIDHESTAALASATDGIESLEVKLTELTGGKMEALRLQFQFIKDGAIEMSGKMLSMFDQMGKQIDKQLGTWEKIKGMAQFTGEMALGSKISAGLTLSTPTQGEDAAAFGSALSKTLDAQGTAAGIHLVAEEVRNLDTLIAKKPDDIGLKEFRLQLEKVRDLLNSGLKTEALEKAVNLGEQGKEAAAEAAKAAREAARLAKEYEESAKAIFRMTELQDKLVAGAAKLADEQKLFGTQVELKGSEQQLKALQEVSNAEEKFRNESMQRSMEAADFAINEKIREVQALKSIGEISVRDGATQINSLVAQRLAADEKLLNEEIALIGSRLEQERAVDAKGYAQDLAAFSIVLKKKQQLEQQAAAQIEKNDDQANLKMIQSFKKSFDQISTDLNRGVVSWINGTESFGRAIAHVWTGVADMAIESILKMGESYVEGIAIKKAMALISKTTDASTAASGAFASQAAIPIVGPELGAAAAAAAYAEVMAFEKGGIVGGSAGLALLHPREMVLPSQISQSVQQMAASGSGGAGGGVSHFHVQNHFHGNPSSSDIEKMEKQMVAVVKRARRRGSF